MKSSHSNQIPVALLILICSISNPAYNQDLSIKWEFHTGDKVSASPVTDNNTVYIGSENGIFFALDANNGKKLWQYKTRGYILGKATIHNDLVFFESSNVFYALDKATGEERWKYDLDWDIWGYKIDHWDDIRSSAIVYDDVFYIGTSLGTIIGLDAKTGEAVFTLAKGINAPIRCTPAIYNGNIYFGDWNGKIYCHSLATKELLWEKETVKKKYYDSFGPIVSEMGVYNGKLFFGARNPQLTVLDAQKGEPFWIRNENDSTGGWIVGSPVVVDNLLYIGGSDSFEMFALDVENGDVKWTFNCGLNIYTKPLITKEHIIFTAGSAYWYFKNYHPPSGMLGGLFILNRESGELISKQEFKDPIFSSPSYDGIAVYFGSYDGNVYAIKYEE